MLTLLSTTVSPRSVSYGSFTSAYCRLLLLRPCQFYLP